jgi:hypothetical protein
MPNNFYLSQYAVHQPDFSKMEISELREKKFKDIDLADPFFDTLKTDYPNFATWFNSKAENTAYTFRSSDGQMDGFLYLKAETGAVTDVQPNLRTSHRLKIGTFKINPHGTRLGERFIKRAFDVAVDLRVEALYVTVFEKHIALVELFARYGFSKVAIKVSPAGDTESVYERRLDQVACDVVLDYPRIPLLRDRHFVLSLYPEWHSRLLPDSLLRTENSSILNDVSHTNSIHKIYLTAMRGVEHIKRGDTLLIYRTAQGGSGYYTSVVTSLCVVEELSHIDQYMTVQAFLDYCKPYSIFTQDELRFFYTTKRYPWLIRFTYNIALSKRLNRKTLLEEVGLAPDTYWGFFKLSTDQLKSILKLSGDYEKARTLVYTP